MINFGFFLCQKKPEKEQIQKIVFVEFSFVTKHLLDKFQKISSQFEFWQFSSFLVNLAVYWLLFCPKKAKQNTKFKKKFFCGFFFCCETSTKQISENFINGLNFASFLHFWSILAVYWLLFLPKKGQKKYQIRKKVFLWHFLLLRNIY